MPKTRMPYGYQVDYHWDEDEQHQHHSEIELWCCICNHDEFGKVPGKTDGENAWFPYGDVEHHTTDFKIVRNGKFSREPVGKAHCKQDDGHKVHCAVANTEHGRIPGKASGDTCWYSYKGKEILTSNFWFLNRGKKFEQSDSSSSDQSDSD